ncbi:aquaporin [Microbacterium awajiense]|uniref:aquaporin n=1 Tax=Microbacterium awajiense TaxID=415214 RepID=UPI0031D23A58
MRAVAGEFLGSAGLAAVVIGSGIAAQRLSPGDVGLQLFENAFATALGLAVLILMFATVSGSHFNPVVTLVDVALHRRDWTTVAAYLPAQVVGCISGAVLANLMFAAPAISWSTNDRASWPTLLSEVVATAGLIFIIFALVRTGRSQLAAPAVGAYIGAAYFFTSSTSFANPAITIGRMFSDTFAGIAPASALPFIGAQLIGAALGALAVALLVPAATASTGPSTEAAEPGAAQPSAAPSANGAAVSAETASSAPR